MVYALKVFKKTSPNGKVTAYLGKRDFIDNVAKVEPISGVVVVDSEYLKNRKVFGQVVCSFRYGREEDEVMGLQFQKDLLMASGEIGLKSSSAELTKTQEHLMKKLGSNAVPFTFELPKNSPPSVTLQPGPDVQGKPCGVEYYLKVFVGETMDDRAHKRSTVTMVIRVIQFAPSRHQDRQPCTVVRRDFVLSPGDLELELNLDKQLYYHGEQVAVHMAIQNRSNKTVKKIRAQILQCIDVCLFEHGTYKTPVASLDTTDGCPIPPGGTLHRTIHLTPAVGSATTDRHGVALDGRLHNEHSDLASTTLMANPDERDSFGIVVTYIVKVRLFLGALAGELVGELPIILMHPKPSGKKLSKMDSVAMETFRHESLDHPPSIDEAAEDVGKMKLDNVE